MNKLFLICLLCLPTHFCSAQNDSKIFFFRNDTSLVMYHGNYPLFMDNEKKVQDILAKSFFIYKSNKINDDFYIYRHEGKKIKIESDPGTITFVALELNVGFIPDKNTMTKISMADFKHIYSRKKWLRKKMAKAGYKSVEDLVNGYKVNE